MGKVNAARVAFDFAGVLVEILRRNGGRWVSIVPDFSLLNSFNSLLEKTRQVP